MAPGCPARAAGGRAAGQAGIQEKIGQIGLVGQVAELKLDGCSRKVLGRRVAVASRAKLGVIA
jgi:hypothetical protein